MARKGSFGALVTVAAKAHLSGMGVGNLHFYTYDAASNAYREIQQANSLVGANGYLHFTTNAGDAVIISGGPLARR